MSYIFTLFICYVSESNNENEVFTGSLTSHVTVSNSSETKASFLSGDSSKPNQFQHISIPQSTQESIVESQFSSSMPYLEGSDQTEVTKDSVFVPYENWSKDEEIKELPGSRNTRSQSPERYGKVYTVSALSPNVSSQSWYKQTIFIPCNMYT